MNLIYKHLNLDRYSISKKTGILIFISPILLTLIIGLLLITKSTRAFTFWLLDENSPIEILTFIFFITGSFFGVWFSFKYKNKLGLFFMTFYLVFSLFLFFIAMEEIAWGQWFFNFETPEEWAKINKQGETTLHNIEGLHGHNENLRLLFGLGGLVGILLGKLSAFKKISVPNVLFSWFFIIFFHSTLDVLTHMDNNNHPMQRISELIEMLIGGSALLYLWLNYRTLIQVSKV